MQANRRRDTTPELAVRRRLHAAGYRYFVDRRPLTTLRWKADLVFPVKRVAVFIDGCYWHGCPEHYKVPTVNREYWAPKIERNRVRDRAFDQALAEAGWRVVRAWEHEAPESVVDRVEAALKEGTAWSSNLHSPKRLSQELGDTLPVTRREVAHPVKHHVER